MPKVSVIFSYSEFKLFFLSENRKPYIMLVSVPGFARETERSTQISCKLIL